MEVVGGRLKEREVTDAPGPSGPPTRSLQFGEALSGVELLRLVVRTPALRRAPRGEGANVLVLPGLRAPELSMEPLRRYLEWLGHDAQHWGLGTNRGAPRQDVLRLLDRMPALAADGPVSLVGWSLGGVIAREVARAKPDLVTRVVTFGTPVVGGPAHTSVVSPRRDGTAHRSAGVLERLDAQRPIQVPLTAIYSRRDGVVSWRACIDRTSPDVRHFEAGSTHLGLGIDPDVWLAVAEALASRA